MNDISNHDERCHIEAEPCHVLMSQTQLKRLYSQSNEASPVGSDTSELYFSRVEGSQRAECQFYAIINTKCHSLALRCQELTATADNRMPNVRLSMQGQDFICRCVCVLKRDRSAAAQTKNIIIGWKGTMGSGCQEIWLKNMC